MNWKGWQEEGYSGLKGLRHKSFYESLLVPHKVAFPRDLGLSKKKRNKKGKDGFSYLKAKRGCVVWKKFGHVSVGFLRDHQGRESIMTTTPVDVAPGPSLQKACQHECLNDNGSRAVRSAEIIMADGVFAKALFELFYINLVNTHDK